MQAFFSRLQTLVEEQLTFVHSKYTKEQQAEEACKILHSAYARLEGFENRHVFRSKEEEITYFKVLKPKISSKLIYYSRVHWIEIEKPNGNLKVKKDYLMNELEKIRAYFEENISFISYYKANEQYRDHLYFLRSAFIKEQPATSFKEGDKDQTISYDFKIAKTIANDLLETYLREELRHLSDPPKPDFSIPEPVHKLTWTDSKAAMIELIYAFQVSKSFNKGTAEIKDIAEVLQSVFNVNLGDYYRAYVDMRLRKTGRTKFLDSLRVALLAKMDE